MTSDEQVQQLEKRLADAERKIAELEETAVIILGNVEATTVQVALKGIRRKITHAAP